MRSLGEQRSFDEANKLSSDILLAKVQELGSRHRQGSIIRNQKALHVLEFVKQGLGSVSTIIGGASGFGIGSLVLGALKLVVDDGAPRQPFAVPQRLC